MTKIITIPAKVARKRLIRKIMNSRGTQRYITACVMAMSETEVAESLSSPQFKYSIKKDD